MRAHIASLISGHVGVGQCCRAIDVESPTILPTMKTLSRVTFQRGGYKFKESSKYEHTYLASFWYTLVSVSVAVPAMWSPPPSNCQRNHEHADGAALNRETLRTLWVQFEQKTYVSKVVVPQGGHATRLTETVNITAQHGKQTTQITSHVVVNVAVSQIC